MGFQSILKKKKEKRKNYARKDWLNVKKGKYLLQKRLGKFQKKRRIPEASLTEGNSRALGT